MNVPTRLVAFGVGLLAIFALGLAIGAAAGPEPASSPPVEMHR